MTNQQDFEMVIATMATESKQPIPTKYQATIDQQATQFLAAINQLRAVAILCPEHREIAERKQCEMVERFEVADSINAH